MACSRVLPLRPPSPGSPSSGVLRFVPFGRCPVPVLLRFRPGSLCIGQSPRQRRRGAVPQALAPHGRDQGHQSCRDLLLDRAMRLHCRSPAAGHDEMPPQDHLIRTPAMDIGPRSLPRRSAKRIANGHQLQPGKSDPAPDDTPATASVLGQVGPAYLQALREPESPPMANSSSRQVRPQMLAARPWAGAEWPRQRTTRMVRPIVPGAFSTAQNAHFRFRRNRYDDYTVTSLDPAGLGTRRRSHGAPNGERPQ